MTDLTEQWKKGELPEGFYYVRCDCSYDVEIRYVHNGVDDWQEIIAEVPSYDEWEASEKYNKHLEEVIKVYERKDKQATETSIAYNELLEENAQLKELMKETKTAISSALNFLACADRISETECNEQLAFDVLRKALEELEK